ncbi:DNRLRE domain-containing protein [Caldilinea sp.]|uniref:DNRLRE domain-containing protein n=1 Tax=Caldilinea sp. TaxID=2293560 RepID=UPI002CD0860C|nr:DNRLRE domain-containing protein [Caldilinea sp.]
MSKQFTHFWLSMTTRLVLLGMLLALLLPASGLSAAPAALTFSVEIPASGDAGAIESVPTFTAPGNPYFVLNARPGGDFDYNFVQFDLSVLPANATIDSAVFRLHVNASANPLDIELGRVDGAWDEATLTWNGKPAVTWGGAVQNAPVAGNVDWPIKPLLSSWLDGTQPSYGIVLRGLTPTTGGVRADTREGAVAPRLVITYTLPPDEGPRPDLGDAPDSSNHHGVVNSAYAGVPGNFPTVWDVPAGQIAGPRHLNQTMEGWLGQHLSREAEADQGPDQDGPNNILRNAAGVIGDVANQDRGDDGWRNRQIRFFDCRRTTLEVRVSKDAAATRNFMYLNVWFDGNRDGDWADISPCQQTETEPAQAGYEWIVQNYVVDMTAIPAGGWRDFLVNTEKVFNSTQVQPHWMRFTLSEAPAVQPAPGSDGPGLPDGRGPHPTSAFASYRFGETEDILQKPSPAGEEGVLKLEKRVITPNGEPVDYADQVTYQIRLRHVGGSQPIQAQIRDELPYPLHLLPTIDGGNVVYVKVESPTNGAMPLQATLDWTGNPQLQQVVKWEGSILPDAEVVLTFTVHVHPLCQANQQTFTFTNTAQARTPGGPELVDATTFTAKCPGYDATSFDFELDPITHTLDLDDLTNVPVRLRINSRAAVSATLGLFQQPDGAGATPRFLDRVTLDPNVLTTVDLDLRMEAEVSDELALPDDYTPSARIVFCVLPGEDNRCPDTQQFPHLNGELPPLNIPIRPHDLGDAPDSSNHTAGANMAAYPGVQAFFPTVFDPATGLPEGPLHRHPRPFHLGKRVSLEAEADVGPDQDPLHNIEPAANDPDNDRGDDGTNLALWNLNNCQTTTLPVKVFISPQAVAYFQQLGGPGYINIWLDSNRDGDWADATQCGGQPAVEHIVIDQPVNVVGLGAGLHLVNVPTGLVPWQNPNPPAWVRITLSERPSNKTLAAGGLSYGDGRGYPVPFKTGETEDYIYRPAQADGAGPDMDVLLTANSRRSVGQVGSVQSAAADKLGNFEIQDFKIEYGNRGTRPAQGATLTFQIPPQLRGNQLVTLQAPGIASGSIVRQLDSIQFALPVLQPGESGEIVLGWYGCLTCTVAASNASDVQMDVQAAAQVTLAGDIDSVNNQSSATAYGLLSSPIIGAFMDYSDDALLDRTFTGRAATCRAGQMLHGRAEPNRIIAILIGLVQVGVTTSDANGDFSYTATLPNGVHQISARYAQVSVNAAQATITSPRDVASGQATGILVNDALPFDPMSVTFTDSQGRTIAVPTFGFSWGVSQTSAFLRSGESYQIGVDRCGSDPNTQMRVVFNDLVISSLMDADGDGRYTGSFIYGPAVSSAGIAAAPVLQLVATRNGAQQVYAASVQAPPVGSVRNLLNGQPVANASVAALLARASAAAGAVFDLLTASELGQTNPAVTGGDGSYSFTAPAGTYRLDVTQNGYQPYRSGDIDVADDGLAADLALTPVVAEAATHTIYMTANGFDPAVLTVRPDSVVEWVNLDLAEHSTLRGGGWDSGLLAAGERYKIKLASEGSFLYADGQNPFNRGAVVVSLNAAPTGNQLFLPVVTR